jgi:hypothetical protein
MIWIGGAKDIKSFILRGRNSHENPLLFRENQLEVS